MGGGVYNAGTFMMEGGALRGNTAQSAADDFYNSGGTFTLLPAEDSGLYGWYQDGPTETDRYPTQKIEYTAENADKGEQYLTFDKHFYTITATAGEGGTITPSGATTVQAGAGQTYTIAANDGYKISEVTVDNTSVGAVGRYDFTDIRDNHAIVAAFTQVQLQGAGTADAPYQIFDAEDLEDFRDTVNSGCTDAHAVLTANIDLGGSGSNPWTPIGSDNDHAYTGTFDGGGHTIEGLYINSEATYAGLFGVVDTSGKVQGLTVAGEVTGSDGSTYTYTYTYTGGVAGQNHGTIADCSFAGTVTGGNCYTYVGAWWEETLWAAPSRTAATTAPSPASAPSASPAAWREKMPAKSRTATTLATSPAATPLSPSPVAWWDTM